MIYRIKLDTQHHEAFLLEQRRDPVTKEPLRAGDEVIVCAKDKLVFIADNWLEACPICNSIETLPFIPINNFPQKISSRRINLGSQNVPRSVFLLAPIVEQQENQYKLYIQNNGMFGGYVREDGTLTEGMKPFDAREIAAGISFDSTENAIEWAKEHNFQIININKALGDRTVYSKSSILIGILVLLFAIAIVAADPTNLIPTSVFFFVLSGFLIYSGIKNIRI